MKLISGLFKLCLLLLILALVFHNFTAKLALAMGLRAALGAPVKIEKVRIDLWNTHFLFRGIEISNPYDFPKGLMVKIPKIFIDLELSSLWEGRVHLEVVEIDVEELRVVRFPDGQMNLLSLGALEPKSRERASGRGAEREGGRKPIGFQIDRLVLTFSRATYMDLTGPSPAIRNFDLHIENAVYRNVSGVQDIVRIISWEALKRMGLGQLSGLVGRLEKELGFGASGARGFLEKAAAAIQEKL